MIYLITFVLIYLVSMVFMVGVTWNILKPRDYGLYEWVMLNVLALSIAGLWALTLLIVN